MFRAYHILRSLAENSELEFEEFSETLINNNNLFIFL